MTPAGARMVAAARAGRSVRPLVLAAVLVALEGARAAGVRRASIPALLAGGAALMLLAWGTPPSRLGLGPGRLLHRLLGTAALTAVLLLPAAARWTGQPPLGGWFALAAVVIAIGQEVAYRGVLFAALEDAWGPVAAVAGSTLVWTAAHAFAHPPEFLPAVAGAGLVLGLWRLWTRDLAAPIAAHALADIAL